MKTAAVIVALVMPLALFAKDSGDAIIAIDIGHDRQSSGAVSARGEREFFFNQRMARLILAELERRGFREALIVNAEGAPISLYQRSAIANRRKANLFLSVHHDSVQPHYLSRWQHEGRERGYSDRFRGYSLFVSYKNPQPEKSLRFAKLIGEELRSRNFVPTLHHAEPIKGENRELLDRELGIYRYDDLIVLKTTKMPAVLLECGVIIHRDEEKDLNEPAYRQRLVEAVADAVEKSVSPAISP